MSVIVFSLLFGGPGAQRDLHTRALGSPYDGCEDVEAQECTCLPQTGSPYVGSLCFLGFSLSFHCFSINLSKHGNGKRVNFFCRIPGTPQIPEFGSAPDRRGLACIHNVKQLACVQDVQQLACMQNVQQLACLQTCRMLKNWHVSECRVWARPEVKTPRAQNSRI